MKSISWGIFKESLFDSILYIHSYNIFDYVCICSLCSFMSEVLLTTLQTSVDFCYCSNISVKGLSEWGTHWIDFSFRFYHKPPGWQTSIKILISALVFFKKVPFIFGLNTFWHLFLIKHNSMLCSFHIY